MPSKLLKSPNQDAIIIN